MLSEAENIKEEEFNGQIEFVLDSWDETVLTDVNKAKFCIDLIRLNPMDSMLIRNALFMATKAFLPPNLARPSIIKSLGIRNPDISLQEILFRFESATHLRGGIYVFWNSNSTWEFISSIDEFVATAVLSGTKEISNRTISLDLLLEKGRFFKQTPKLKKIVEAIRPKLVNAEELKTILNNATLTKLGENLSVKIAKSLFVPNTIVEEKFEDWWTSKLVEEKKVDKNARLPEEARSLKELHALLEVVEPYKINEKNVEKIKSLFEKLRRVTIEANPHLLIESLSMLEGDRETLHKIGAPLLGKAPFWPETLGTINLEDFDAWTKTPVKKLGQFINLTKILFSGEYLAQIAMFLPSRCLNTLCCEIEPELLKNALEISSKINCDILKWIWSNRKKDGETLTEFLNIKNVCDALGSKDIPSAWLVAQRELKKMFIEKEEFQKFIIEKESDPAVIISAIQGTATFLRTEQQTLLVKLSRYSDELKEALNSGDNSKKIKKVVESELLTSPASHKKRRDELENIVKIQIPANVEAIAHARSFGDLKENSEYKAAKENQGFLANRRADLEEGIAKAVVLDFNKIEVSKTAVIGSKISVKSDKGDSQVIYLVGAWDGNPDKDLISYQTPLGVILLGKSVGDKVKFPNKKEFTIESIETLPKNVLEELTV